MNDDLKYLISNFYGNLPSNVYNWHKQNKDEEEKLTVSQYQSAIRKYQKLTSIDMTKIIQEGDSTAVRKIPIDVSHKGIENYNIDTESEEVKKELKLSDDIKIR